MKQPETVKELKAIAAELENKFFTPGALEFFNSVIETDVIKKQFFITSEQDKTGQVWDGRRRFTIRAFAIKTTLKGSNLLISDVGEFGEYSSLDEALKALDEMGKV
jgi:3-isopropylmalate dehydratase small subunit